MSTDPDFVEIFCDDCGTNLNTPKVITKYWLTIAVSKSPNAAVTMRVYVPKPPGGNFCDMWCYGKFVDKSLGK